VTQRDEFVERRRSGIGGSDVAAILGVSKWSDPIRVYLQKRGLLEIEESAVMERGRYREDSILRWYADAHGVTRLGSGFYTHPTHPWLIANLDDEVYVESCDPEDVYIVDAKKVSFTRADEWGDDGSDQIPDDAFFQGLHYCYVRRRAKCVFVAEIGDRWPPRIFEVKRDDELYELLLPQLESFWNDHVLKGEPPDPDFAKPSIIEAIKALYPSVAIEARTIDLPETLTVHVRESKSGVPVSREVSVRAADVVEMINFLKARRKRDEALVDRLDAVLRHHLGDAQIGRVMLENGQTVDVKRVFNKGGSRPATTIDPYDYLRINFPKNHEHALQAGDALALLEGETTNG
jgi:predicted phage-related endonuclease